ncbi:hypothetical protein [Streptosporangium sp. NPDC000396]|uniref:hypothetical protein n=1 Tax=Streptosporangium sp. NPDC000396 TaxID=3366185 RepID=UPI003694F576
MAISHTDLRHTETGLRETGTSRLEELRDFRAYLEGEGDPWGDDELGSMVGAAYHAITQRALEVYTSLAERHLTTGGNVGVMSVNHRSAEQRSVEESERIMRAVRQV